MDADAELAAARAEVEASRRYRDEVDLLQARKELERSRWALEQQAIYGHAGAMRVTKAEKTKRRKKAKAAKMARRRARA